MQTAIKVLNPVVACLIVFFMPVLVMGQPLLDQVPDHLLEQPGLECRSGHLFVSAFAQTGHYRQDKAYDAARKRSLARAMHMVHLALADLGQAQIQTQNPANRNIFRLETKRTTPGMSLSGIAVLGQWEQAQGYMTLMAVSLDSLNRTCRDICLDSVIFPDHARQTGIDSQGNGQPVKERRY